MPLGTHTSTLNSCGFLSVRITWKPEYAGPPHLFSLSHRANAVAKYLGTDGPHTYFSVIRLMGFLGDRMDGQTE